MVTCRVRRDREGGNIGVANCMLQHPLHRRNPRSFIAGRSVHKHSIGRLWKDLAVPGAYEPARGPIQQVAG